MVNKLDSIDTEFRVFKMEVLAGEDDFVAEMVSINHATLDRQGCSSELPNPSSIVRCSENLNVNSHSISPKSTGTLVWGTNTNVSSTNFDRVR